MNATAAPMHQFALFSHLPREIRLDIWRLCLPRRVLEVNYTDSDVEFEVPHQVSSCCEAGRPPSDTNCLPPLLLRVCQESRQVALENGHVAFFDDWATWRQPRRDKWLLWHWTGSSWFGETTEAYQKYEGDRLRKFFAWAARTYMTPCFYHILIHFFRQPPTFYRSEFPLMGSPQASQLAVFAELAQGMRLRVTLYTIILHVTKQDAARSGLFGAFGEDTVQLVDAYDHDEIRAYHEFWSSYSMDKDPVVTEAFDAIMTRDSFLADVAAWIEKANFVLLAAIWNAARFGRSTCGDIEYSERVFSPRVAPDEFPDMNVHTMDSSHPWVVRKRAELPKLLPRIDFRCCSFELCLQECGAIPRGPKRPVSPWRAPFYNRHRPGTMKYCTHQTRVRQQARRFADMEEQGATA